MDLPVSLDYALELIANNSQSIKSEKPALHYLDDDLIRDIKIRHDYEFPYLHHFMRLQRTSLSIWPQ